MTPLLEELWARGRSFFPTIMLLGIILPGGRRPHHKISYRPTIMGVMYEPGVLHLKILDKDWQSTIDKMLKFCMLNDLKWAGGILLSTISLKLATLNIYPYPTKNLIFMILSELLKTLRTL